MSWKEETIARLRERAPELRREWSKPAAFPYVVIDDFLPPAAMTALLASYPGPDFPAWTRKTYPHQRDKLVMAADFPAEFNDFFDFTAADEFRALVSEITGIDKLLPDPELVGGGLHQITQGGFLDVHIDFNFHPKSKLHRRLNLLLYLNEGWKEEYEGHLELWDMSKPGCIERIAPFLNRAVIFETNEVSYHGHPKPLECPLDVTRKSLAIYYYTEARDGARVADEHSTIYRQTTGTDGYLKTARSTVSALRERFGETGVRGVTVMVGEKIYRKLRGLPPRNS